MLHYMPPFRVVFSYVTKINYTDVTHVAADPMFSRVAPFWLKTKNQKAWVMSICTLVPKFFWASMKTEMPRTDCSLWYTGIKRIFPKKRFSLKIMLAMLQMTWAFNIFHKKWLKIEEKNIWNFTTRGLGFTRPSKLIKMVFWGLCKS